jgi:predicted DNA-binding transcriptional regulator YafY
MRPENVRYSCETRRVPVADSASTSRRLLALLSLLQARRDWPARVLAGRLGVSERTVRRDVERLRELDYAIEATRGPDGGYRLGAGDRMPPLVLDEEQAVAIALALRSAAAVGAGIEDAAERALRTMTRLLPRHLAARLALEVTASAPEGPPEDLADPEVLLRIGDAIRAREELRFDYRSPPGGTPLDPTAAPRRVEPHHLLLHAGRWYLLGYVADSSRWSIHRVDRILPRSHTGRRFAPRDVPGGDPGRYLAARFKGSAGADTWACWGEATLAAPLRDVAPFVGDGRVEELAPGVCRVRLGAWSWAAVAASFSRFAVDTSEVEPRELREAFEELAARAARAAASTPS